MALGRHLSRPGPSGDPLSGERVVGTFLFEGRVVPFLSTDTVGSALLRVGAVALRRSPSGEARGLFCGIGVCYECLIQTDGKSDQRACLERPRAGAQIGITRR